MFLKNKNIIFKIRRSKVTDYGALTSSNDNVFTFRGNARIQRVLSEGSKLRQRFLFVFVLVDERI